MEVAERLVTGGGRRGRFLEEAEVVVTGGG